MDKARQNKNQLNPQIVEEQVPASQTIAVEKPAKKTADEKPVEVNGPKGLEPTRYGDWEANGRCYDF